MTVFKLPDLGEGLQDAEIRAWHVAAGDTIEQDKPLVSVETDKAVVDIPSPRSGKILKLCARPGDIVKVGAPLVEYAGTGGQLVEQPVEQRGEQPAEQRDDDAGTVVGHVERTTEAVSENATSVGRAAARVQAAPAVRALARQLNVDLNVVTPTGPDDTITAGDVRRVAGILADVGPLEPLRGFRRTMARAMAQAHEEVAAATVVDDADIGEWFGRQDITVRLVCAVIAAREAEPALNAWYDAHAVGRRVLKKIHLGIAMDTPDGLFVPVLRDVASVERDELRPALERLKTQVSDRTIAPEDLRGHTFILTNFGTFGARYASPIVLPPTVAILGCGRARREPVVVGEEIVARAVLPLSLTFDHRAVTGGEATRFLAAVVQDLRRAESQPSQP